VLPKLKELKLDCGRDQKLPALFKGRVQGAVLFNAGCNEQVCSPKS